MGGIEPAARSIGAVLGERLPWQRKTQRETLALLVATMLSERSANLMALAAALPRPAGRIDMRYQWIVRVLANPLIECEAVMLPFAREVLGRAQAEAGPGERVDLILDQSRASERHQILSLLRSVCGAAIGGADRGLALRWGERALPLAWRVEETEGPIGFAVQKRLLDAVAAWLPEAARVRLLGDRFYGTPALIAHCQALDWDYRLRLKGNLRLWIDGAYAGSVEKLARSTPSLSGVELTARRVRTNIGFIQDHRLRRSVCEAAGRSAAGGAMRSPGSSPCPRPLALSPRSTPRGVGASSRCSPTSRPAASASKTVKSDAIAKRSPGGMSAKPTGTGWPGSSWSWRSRSTSRCPPASGMLSTMPRPPNAGTRISNRRTCCAA
jgi:hypothetical protein